MQKLAWLGRVCFLALGLLGFVTPGASIAAEIGIAWPIDPAEAILSDRDRKLPRFRELDSPFTL